MGPSLNLPQDERELILQRIEGFGFRILRFRVFRIWVLGFKVQDLRFGIHVLRSEGAVSFFHGSGSIPVPSRNPSEDEIEA